MDIGIQQRLDALEARTQLLEGRVRRTRWVAVALGVGLGLTVLVGAGTTSASKVAELQEVRIVDDHGIMRVSLTGNPKGPGLAVFDTEGNVKASLAMVGETPALTIGSGGASRAVLSASDTKGSSLILQEAGGHQAVMLAQPQGPALALIDKSGQNRFVAPP